MQAGQGHLQIEGPPWSIAPSWKEPSVIWKSKKKNVIARSSVEAK
jgi:hypothetical protein